LPEEFFDSSSSAVQRVSISAFQRVSTSAFQRVSISAFQRVSTSAFQLFSPQRIAGAKEKAKREESQLFAFGRFLIPVKLVGLGLKPPGYKALCAAKPAHAG